MTRTTLVRTALAVLTVTGVLAGCGGGTDHDLNTADTAGAKGGASVHNKADVTFAQQMIPHHAQAVEMAKLVPGQTSNPEILDLATRIEKAQDPEMQTMTKWLEMWGESPHATNPDGSHDMPMPGMMSHEELVGLAGVKGNEFDRMWLAMMIRHHEGALEMANTLLREGSDAEAKKLAQQILDTQQAEIKQMQALLPQG